jgi:hypothetical protein
MLHVAVLVVTCPEPFVPGPGKLACVDVWELALYVLTQILLKAAQVVK